MYYIYCYENKQNGHKYVGQTNNIERRKREHRSVANNQNDYGFNSLFHRKMREYGEENFEFCVIEALDTDDQDYVNLREIYWIQELQSYVRTGRGYNLTEGGGGNRSEVDRVLSNTEVLDLIAEIKAGESYDSLTKKYKIAVSYISMINHGQSFRQQDEEYPLYRYYKSDEEYEELIELLQFSDLTLVEIAERLNIGYSTVKKINAGTLRKGLWHEYPIRKETPQKRRAKRIQELLLQGYDNQTIVSETGASKATVNRINSGETHNDPSLSYPLR